MEVKPTPVPRTNPPGPRATNTIISTIHPAVEPDGTLRAEAFADRQRGWMGIGGSIQATIDGGQTWQSQHEAPSFVNALDVVSPTFVWAATESGLLFTNDGGRSWRPAELDVREVRLVDFVDQAHGWVAAGGQPPQVFRTTDGGHTWKSIDQPCASPWTLGSFSFVGPEVGWVICAGQGATAMQTKQLFKTTNGGEHWQSVAEAMIPTARRDEDLGQLPLSGHLQSLFFLDETRGWLGMGRAPMYTTRNGGLSWEAVGDLSTGEVSIGNVRFLDAVHGFALYHFGPPMLVSTEDGGASWHQIYPTVEPTQYWRFFDAQHGVGASTVLEPRAILRTVDGGRSWEKLGSVPDLGPGGRGAPVSFSDLERGWAIGETGTTGETQLYRTIDGGATWELLWSHSMEPKERYQSLSFVDAHFGFATSGWGAFAMTQDGGRTFELIHPPGGVPGSIDFVTPELGWQVGDGELMATADGGRTWTSIPLGYRAGQVELGPGGRAWVTAADCASLVQTETRELCEPLLLATTDGGTTWTRYDLGSIWPSKVTFADDLHGWLWDDQQRVYRTTDGGHNWTQFR